VKTKLKVQSAKLKRTPNFQLPSSRASQRLLCLALELGSWKLGVLLSFEL